MRKPGIFLMALLGFTAALQAQILEPVKWSFETEQTGDGTYDLLFRASIDEGWHLYSHYIEDGGPIPTSFYLNDDPAWAMNGPLREEGEREASFDEIFGMDLAWFSNEALFRQPVKLADPAGRALITGELEFMVCNDRECLPPETVPFRLAVGSEDAAADEAVSPEPETGGTAMIPGFGPGGDLEIEDPVSWSYRLTPETGGNYLLEWRAEVDAGWHIYAHDIGDEGPVPTSVVLDGQEGITAVSALKAAGDRITKFDEVFGMELSWFDEEVVFSQRIRWDADGPASVTGYVEFMVCDDEKCLPPDEAPFDIARDAGGDWVPFGSARFVPVEGGCEELPDIMCEGLFDDTFIANDCTGKPAQDSERNYLLIFLIGFGGGLIALLTPCVFPMIPLTVSYFTKGASQPNARGVRNAILYGISIIVIYVALGLSVTLIFGPEMLNWIATDPIFNVFFFLIFVFFAFSFFGYYELTLPSRWTNKTDQIAAKGGLIGIFFMAFTLALVSFSCTGPIIGSLIVEAVRQGFMGPFFGMLGFAVALALPFTLFAVFPKWLNSLPQSGGWMNSIKISLGFLELAFALKFLSTADLTRHWGILKYELFIGLWIIIFALLALYYLGVFRFPHERRERPGVIRKFFGVASLAFAVWLTMGVVQQKPLLGGIAPAPGYSLFNPSKCPIGVNVCFHDYEKGMAYAREVKKPVMLDFTGYGCVNCRLMENNVWIDPEVNQVLNEYVIISLYVDDRAELPVEKQYISTATGKVKEIKKVGKYWHDFQFRHFGTLSQPYYVLVAPEGQILNKPIAYSGKEEYLDFLNCGLNQLEGVCPECDVGIGVD